MGIRPSHMFHDALSGSCAFIAFNISLAEGLQDSKLQIQTVVGSFGGMVVRFYHVLRRFLP